MTEVPEASSRTASFDLETYIGRYNPSSETRLQRLLFIGENSNDAQVSKLSFEMADCQMREYCNVRKYKEVFHLGGDSQGQPYDAEWVAETEEAAQGQLQVLEGRLSAAQAHLNKEAIRAAYLALGDFHRRRGELRDAMRVVLRSRDYCTSRGQTGHVCLLVMEMAIDFRNYAQVRDYVAKAEHTSIPSDIHFPSKLRVASGLAYLAEGRYWEAAQKFISVAGPPLDDFDSVVSTEDIALYGALLALATFDRSDLCSMLEPSSTTSTATSTTTASNTGTTTEGTNTTNSGLSRMAAGLELVPPVRDALRHFSRAEYRICLNVLASLQPQLELDLHLSSHVPALLEMIRDKCLVEYLRPYRRIHLESMASDFGLSGSELQAILGRLIGQGQIGNARMDCRTKTLSRELDDDSTDRQRAAKLRVSQLGNRVLNETHAMIVRLACLEHDMIVQSEKSFAKDGAAGGNAYWNARPGMDTGGFEEMYDSNESSDNVDTPMVDLVSADHNMANMVNPEDLY